MASPNQMDPLQKTAPASSGGTRSAVHEASQAAKDQASAVWSDTKDSARSMIGEQQKAAASGLGQFAGALRKAAREMGDGGQQAPMSRMIESAADGLERFSGSLREKDLDGLVRDVESFARRQPIMFFGAAIAAGFLAVRFMKATRPSDDQQETPY